MPPVVLNDWWQRENDLGEHRPTTGLVSNFHTSDLLYVKVRALTDCPTQLIRRLKTILSVADS